MSVEGVPALGTGPVMRRRPRIRNDRRCVFDTPPTGVNVTTHSSSGIEVPGLIVRRASQPIPPVAAKPPAVRSNFGQRGRATLRPLRPWTTVTRLSVTDRTNWRRPDKDLRTHNSSDSPLDTAVRYAASLSVDSRRALTRKTLFRKSSYASSAKNT